MQRFKDLIDDQGEATIIVTFDSDTHSYEISAYAPIPLSDLIPSTAIMSQLYLSQCTNIPMPALFNSINSMVFIPADTTNSNIVHTTFKAQPMIIT